MPKHMIEETSKRSLDIRSKGAVAGTGDSSAAFLAAMTDAKNSSATLPFSVSSDPSASTVIDLPAGTFTITQLKGMIGNEAKVTKSVGLKIRGAGLGLTNVIFNPTTDGALNFNDYWLAIAFEGITFHAARSGLTFLESFTTHNAQRYSFERVQWTGFKYVIHLQGDNNNSEFYFAYCHASGIGSKETDKTAAAFFYIPAVNSSDQFLNYWFYGCTHWSTSAPFLDASKGGHFHIYALDASDWGSALTAPGYLFYLRGGSHSWGVTTFEAKGVRGEAKSNYAGLLYSEWQNGSVSFDAADWTSQLFVPYTYANLIKLVLSAYVSTQYRFTGCRLAGKVTLSYGTESWRTSPVVKFDQCTFETIASPSDAVIYTSTNPGVNDWMKPRVRFNACIGDASKRSALEAAGYAIWDATIGFDATSGEIEQRQAHFRAGSGTDVVRLVLPTGALLTDFEVMSPAGVITEGDGGTWTFTTSETTPTTLAAITVGTPLTNGYRQASALAVPFWANSADKAKIVMTPTNVGQRNDHCIITVKGYW